MPMLPWCNRLARDTRGDALLEFALFLPVLLTIFLGIVEVGRAVYQSSAVEKGLRIGAFYAARHTVPLGAATKTAVENLVKTGNQDGSGGYLVGGWGKAGAKLAITTSTYTGAGSGTFGLPVVRLAAEVPFESLLPGLTGLFSPDGYKIRLTHEQAYVGD